MTGRFLLQVGPVPEWVDLQWLGARGVGSSSSLPVTQDSPATFSVDVVQRGQLRRFHREQLHLWSICRWHLAIQSATWRRLARSSREGRAFRACRELRGLVRSVHARVNQRPQLACHQLPRGQRALHLLAFAQV